MKDNKEPYRRASAAREPGTKTSHRCQITTPHSPAGQTPAPATHGATGLARGRARCRWPCHGTALCHRDGRTEQQHRRTGAAPPHRSSTIADGRTRRPEPDPLALQCPSTYLT